MPHKVLTITGADGPHTVTLDRSAWTSNTAITLDGQAVPTPRPAMFDLHRVYPLPVPGRQAAIHIRSNGFTYQDDLVVDGQSAVTGRAVAAPLPMPGWAWVFVIACGILFFVGGAIGGAIGIGGALFCATQARNAARPVAARVGLCVAGMIGAWVLYGVVITVLLMMGILPGF
jgi:hypothetical protein